MNEFLVNFLIVSFFALNAFGMDPSNTDPQSPPPRENVEFGDCFVVPEITGEILETAFYSYHHICPDKALINEPDLPEHEKLWYLVGLFKGFEAIAQQQNLPSIHYIPCKQSFIKFVFLKETMVELLFSGMVFKITFESLEQGQAFYKMIPQDANMIVPNKIGLLHEIKISNEYKKIGDNARALHEKINDTWYFTFINEHGEALLVFSENDSKILRITKPWYSTILQVLLQIKTTFYILTFSSHYQAEQLSEGLLKYLKPLHLGRTIRYVKERFENNEITIGP